MNILNRKCSGTAFLGIKTNRNALHGSDIIYRTALVKIGQGYVSGRLINLNRFGALVEYVGGTTENYPSEETMAAQFDKFEAANATAAEAGYASLTEQR